MASAPNHISLAVIGAGQMGRQHAALINAQKDCCLAAICDVDPTAHSVADQFGVPFYHTLPELLESERPDGAIIATPNSEHARDAVLCIQQGVPVLIEKPIADTLAAARQIINASQSARAAVLVGHHRRHNPLVQQAYSILQSDALGPLVGVSVLWALCKPDDYYDQAWRCIPPAGGPTLINLIHDLDSLRYWCGEINEVFAHASSATRQLEVEDSLTISLRFENGTLGSIFASDTTPSPWSYEATTGENPTYHTTSENCYHFFGRRGSLAFPQLNMWSYPDGSPRGWQHPLTHQRGTSTAADPLRIQLQHFCQVVQQRETPLVDAVDASRSLATALAVLESAAHGRAISVAEP